MDSTLLIDVLNGHKIAREAMLLYRDRAISVVSWIEVMAGVRTEEERSVARFLNELGITDISPAIAAEAARLRRSTKLKLPDAVILATAHVEGRTLLTRNTRDFVEGRFVHFPYEL